MRLTALLAVLAVFAAVASLVLADEVLTTGGTEAGKITEVTGGDGGVVKLGDKEIPLADMVRLDFGNKKLKIN